MDGVVEDVVVNFNVLCIVVNMCVYVDGDMG